jgi:hypothetical protein
MKIYVAFFVLAISGHIAQAQTAAEKAEEYYRKGLAAEKAGDPTAASTAYHAALQLVPEHVNARFRAGQVKIEAVSIRAKAAAAKIGGVNIPVYRIEEASISDAFAALEIAIEKASTEVVTPNFIIQDPQGKLTNTRITLQLKNVPVRAILGYIHSQTNTQARYDEHAVIITVR